MPRPKPQESESSGDEGAMPNMADLMRFTNPNYAREFIAGLPENIRNRVAVLQALDDEYKQLKKQMTAEVDAAEREFYEAIAPLNEARSKIVTGAEEPDDAAVKAGFPEEHKGKVSLDGKPTKDAAGGVPNFWLDALRHHVIIDEFISERDAEALTFIKDVKCTMLTPPDEGFTITFVFNENPFFEDTELSKTFKLSREDEEIVLGSTIGCTVNWKSGKNLGKNTVTVKQKSKNKKAPPKYVTREEDCQTFFSFFETSEEEDEEEFMAMADTLKEKIIPFAVDYFTGEAPNGESDLEDDDEYDDEDEEEEEDDEPMPAMRGRGRGGPAAAPARGGGARGGRGGGQDCPQQ